MPSMLTRRSGPVLLVAALATATVASAATDGADTTIAVSPRVLIAAPEISPVDFPGVAEARAGRPLPDGDVAVARVVRITRGGEVASAALRMTCPKRRRWRTGASSGAIAVSVLDRVVVRKRSVLVMASVDTRRTARGETAVGTVYALCR